jgi:hypothetical protein
MFLKYIFKSIGLGFLVGLIVYVISKLIGTEVNSTVIAALLGQMEKKYIETQN